MGSPRRDTAAAFLDAVDRLDSPSRAERNRALTKACSVLDRAGLRWRDVIRLPKRRAHIDACLALLERGELLNDWERDFLRGLIAFARLTPKQSSRLDDIGEKVRGLEAAAACSP